MIETAPEARLQSMRVLFVSGLEPDYYGEFRLRALRRLGLEHVAALDPWSYAAPGILGKLEHRLQMGPGILRLNRDLLITAKKERVQVLLFDKTLGLQPRTIRRSRRWVCSALISSSTILSGRGTIRLRLYRKTIPLFDLVGVQRP